MEETVQRASLKLSDSLIWSFDSISAKTENGINTVKDLSEWLKKRAQIEADYAKQVSAWYQTKPGSGMFTKEPPITRESKTIRATVLGTLYHSGNMIKYHQEFSTKIQNDLVKLLDTWVKNKENDRKKIITEGQKNLKTIAEAKANVAKAKENYEKAMKEAELAKDALVKCEKDEVNSPDDKKLQQLTRKASQKYIDCMDKGKKLEAVYQAAVKKGNEDLQAFQEKGMPAVLEQLQKWEEDRWNLLLGCSKIYKSLRAEITQVVEAQLTEIDTLINAASIEEDFSLFVEANVKEAEPALQFVPFKGKYTESEESKEPKEPAPQQEENSFGNMTAEEKLAKQEEEAKEVKEEEAPKKKEPTTSSNLFADEDMF